MSNLTDFLSWLTGASGGAFILLSWLVSWGLSGVLWWEVLTAQAKQLIIIVVAVVLGLLGVWLRSQPTLVATIDPYFQAVMYIVLIWLTTQTVRKVDTLVFKAKAVTIPIYSPPQLPQPSAEITTVTTEAKG